MLTGASKAQARSWGHAWARGGAALALAFGGLTWASGTAQAGVGPCENGYVCVVAGGGSNVPGGGSGGGTGGGGGGTNACMFGGQAMVCYIPGIGWLSSVDGCYYMVMQPPPPAGDPLWQGHQPGDGNIYVRTCSLNGGGGTVSVWLQTPPATPKQMSPAEEAAWMMQVIRRAPATIASAPGPKEEHKHGLVNSPVMLWLVGSGDYAKTHDYRNAKGEWTFIPQDRKIVKTASVPGYWVTAELYSTEVDWYTGDSASASASAPSTTCPNPGTPFQGSYVPDCVHVFTKANSDYGVNAKVVWTVHWYASDGSQGDLDPGGFLSANGLHLAINELQVLN